MAKVAPRNTPVSPSHASGTVNGGGKQASAARDERAGLTDAQLLGLYRTMYASRKTDDKDITFKKLNLSFFQISGAGHDAMEFPTVAPTAMLFVRCGNNGISHHPDETMTAEERDHF